MRCSRRDSTKMAEELAQRKLFIGGLSYATDDGEYNTLTVLPLFSSTSICVIPSNTFPLPLRLNPPSSPTQISFENIFARMASFRTVRYIILTCPFSCLTFPLHTPL